MHDHPCQARGCVTTSTRRLTLIIHRRDLALLDIEQEIVHHPKVVTSGRAHVKRLVPRPMPGDGTRPVPRHVIMRACSVRPTCMAVLRVTCSVERHKVGRALDAREAIVDMALRSRQPGVHCPGWRRHAHVPVAGPGRRVAAVLLRCNLNQQELASLLQTELLLLDAVLFLEDGRVRARRGGELVAPLLVVWGHAAMVVVEGGVQAIVHERWDGRPSHQRRVAWRTTVR